MAHTGVAIGDGTCVHSRGTAYGVVQQKMSQYAWTHWARPKWPDTQDAPCEEKEELNTMEVLYKATVHAQNGKTVNMRKEPGGDILTKVPVGYVVEVYAEAPGWSKIAYNGKTGYMQIAFLRKNESEFEKQVLAKLDEILKRLAE